MRLITYFMMGIAIIKDGVLKGFEQTSSDTYRFRHKSVFMGPGHNEVQCPRLDDYEGGGAYVDMEYCQSFCRGLGCRELKGCKAWVDYA